MLVLLGVRLYLFHFGCCNIPGKYTAYAHAFAMDLEHDLGRTLATQRKEALQDRHDEIHGGVVVVEQQHLEHRWRLGLGTLRLKDGVFTLPGCHAGCLYVLPASIAARGSAPGPL